MTTVWILIACTLSFCVTGFWEEMPNTVQAYLNSFQSILSREHWHANEPAGFVGVAAVGWVVCCKQFMKIFVSDSKYHWALYERNKTPIKDYLIPSHVWNIDSP